MASVLYTGLCVSMFEPWLGSLCCVLGQDTTLSVSLSPLSGTEMGNIKFNNEGYPVMD